MLEIAEESGTAAARSRANAAPQTSAIVSLGYAVTIFLSAFLLFQVQLIFGKNILPFFGGTPSVWNTCMFCFQLLLLLGYGYAHALKSRSGLAAQGKLHGALLFLSAAVLVILWIKWGAPLTPGNDWKPAPGDQPVVKILELLGVTVALPFFLMSTTGPLLQSWLAQTSGASPYRLYALSNAGSLLGLLSYPFFLEWTFTIKHQAWIWSAGYLIFAALCLGIALQLPKRSAAPPQSAAISRAAKSAPRPEAVRYVLWLALSTCSSIILLSSTNFLCENVAAIPLLWVLPLSIYLLSFMLTFDTNRWYRRSFFWPLYFIALGIGLSPNLTAHQGSLPLLIAVDCLPIFAVCMVCHGELARSKPAPEHLTSFYLALASGGALGGFFVILIAPSVFQGFWEFYIALFGCGFLLFAAFVLEDRSGKSERMAWTASLLALISFLLPHLKNFVPQLAHVALLNKEYYTVPLCVMGFLAYVVLRGSPKSNASETSQFAWQPVAAILLVALFAILLYSYNLVLGLHILYRERNFFGVKYVRDEPKDLKLFSGNTLHGVQLKAPENRDVPTLYYGVDSGIGRLLRGYPRSDEGHGSLRIGVVGAGAGTLAAYGQPGDSIRFYEIDPAVIDMSRGPRPWFTFLGDSLAKVEVVLGDARLSLEREAGQGQRQQFDVLAIDAFSGDSVPVHLLTREAMGVYLEHLRGPDSVLAFHTTNRYLDLAPVLAGLAGAYNLSIVQVDDNLSRWILISRSPSMLRLPGFGEKAKNLELRSGSLLWTDNYSNIFQVLRRPKS